MYISKEYLKSASNISLQNLDPFSIFLCFPAWSPGSHSVYLDDLLISIKGGGGKLFDNWINKMLEAIL